jgi:hypothetical protein
MSSYDGVIVAGKGGWCRMGEGLVASVREWGQLLVNGRTEPHRAVTIGVCVYMNAAAAASLATTPLTEGVICFGVHAEHLNRSVAGNREVLHILMLFVCNCVTQFFPYHSLDGS